MISSLASDFPSSFLELLLEPEICPAKFWAASIGLLGGVMFPIASLNWFPMFSMLGGVKLLVFPNPPGSEMLLFPNPPGNDTFVWLKNCWTCPPALWIPEIMGFEPWVLLSEASWGDFVVCPGMIPPKTFWMNWNGWLEEDVWPSLSLPGAWVLGRNGLALLMACPMLLMAFWKTCWGPCEVCSSPSDPGACVEGLKGLLLLISWPIWDWAFWMTCPKPGRWVDSSLWFPCPWRGLFWPKKFCTWFIKPDIGLEGWVGSSPRTVPWDCPKVERFPVICWKPI